ncbi:hypothetical protein BDQ94DRAFT_34752 [Aspergillus welwitschiae]|uniref:Uncharacterized protein n=1 Tax=Aspergillus welwitschiae TaxID=1341132 RepID=A0A3F3Q2X9_9EURO|nr:hypothetical protein BDQ94DRAFT_34752 [Aspergillus welwitschiae]RDH33342.1 hypothetical protein BDQ94DRAFT_34752 [Aspergillus welwitschiae]
MRHCANSLPPPLGHCPPLPRIDTASCCIGFRLKVDVRPILLKLYSSPDELLIESGADLLLFIDLLNIIIIILFSSSLQND